MESRQLTSQELRAPDAIAEVARRAARRTTTRALELPTRFHVQEVVRDYAEVTRSRGGTLPDEFEDSLARADEIVAAVADDPEHASRPNHDDLLAANFLQSAHGIVIVDWEYAGMGDPFFDLGNFSVNNELSDEDEESLLGAYFGEPATTRRRAGLKLFRFMSDLREAMWGVVQNSVSELDFDFAGYADKHFERLTETGADPRFGTWLEEARGG